MGKSIKPLFVMVLMMCAIGAFAQGPRIVSTMPSQNALNVHAETGISVTFDSDIDETTLTSSTFISYGQFTGYHQGTISYDSGSKTATLDPAADFDAGELVTAILTGGIESQAGVALEKGFVWTFTILAGGDGTVQQAIDTFTIDYERAPMIASDLDGNSSLDLVFAPNCHDRLSIMLNAGNGVLNSPVNYDVGDNPRYIAVADMNNDGDQEIVLSNRDSRDIWVMFNNGLGVFDWHAAFPIEGIPGAITAADFDADGDIDVAVILGPFGDIAILLNDGSGNLLPGSTSIVNGRSPSNLISADLNGDGYIDLATSNSGSNTLSVLLNSGRWGFWYEYGISGCQLPHVAGSGRFQ